MGVDYIVDKFVGFKIPKDLNEHDEKILEELIHNMLIIKPEYEEYMFIYESRIEIKFGRLSHYINYRFGEKIYPDTYIKKITEEDYGKKYYEFNEKLNELSFKPEYNYYEYARISY